MEAVKDEVRKMLDKELNMLALDAENLSYRIHHVQQMLHVLNSPALMPLPLATPSPAPQYPDQELCTCGHTWEDHHMSDNDSPTLECGNSYCRCAQFVGTGKPG